MSNWELFFFFGFLAIQTIYPLLRFAKFLWRPKQSELYGDYFWFFSWTMKLKGSIGTIEIRFFDKNTGETILQTCPVEILAPKQYKCFCAYPSLIIQYAKYLEEKFRLNENNYGLQIQVSTDYNNRGVKKMIDEKVDFTKEKIKTFGTYPWYLGG